MNSKYSIDMTNGPFLGKILKFSLPLMLTGLLQMVYNTADMLVVGRFAGSASLAAVGATGSLVNLVLNIFMGVAMGSGVMAARYIGARDKDKISHCTHCAIALGLVSGIIVAVFGFFMSENLLILMKSPENVLPLSTLYLKIYFLGAPASLVFNFGASVVRATGDTKHPLYILTAAGLVNICFNLIFVIVFDMGVAGVAVATVISQIISAVCIIIELAKMKNECKLYIKKIRIYGDVVKKILLIGIPAGLQNSLFSLSNVIIQTTVNSFGSDAMAGITAGSNYDSYIYTCSNAVSQATMTFSSQNYGAGKYNNIGKIYRQCILIATIIGVGMGALGFFFSNQIVGLFSTETAVIEIGAQRIHMIMPFYFFCSLMDLSGNQLRGMGESFKPVFISLIGGCGLRLLWIFVFFPKNPTLIYLYWAYPISWAITFFVLFGEFFLANRRLKRKIA